MTKHKKIRKITRKCLVCGKKILVRVCRDGYCRNGQYFGTIEVPIGKGEYKKIRTTKIAGQKIDVAEWTGKKKEVEYWECNACFEESAHECWLEQITEKLYGEKCKDYEKGCACCQAWSVYDTIIDHNRGRL